MAKKENALQQTKGFFKLAGIVSGVKRSDFYTEKMTKTDNPKLRKAVKFAVQTSPDNKVFVTLGSQPREKVYFAKRAEVKGEKGTDTGQRRCKSRRNKAIYVYGASNSEHGRTFFCLTFSKT